MHTLTIDIGNTRAKIDRWDDEGLVGREWCGKFDLEKILKVIVPWEIDDVIVSSVRSDAEKVVEELKGRTGCRVVKFDVDEARRFSRLDRYRGNIGADRVAAYLGAIERFPGKSLMIIDMGTAITIDLIDKDGNFCGGNISLGLKSRMKALSEMTARLPLIDKFKDYQFFGSDTASAIQSGAINGAAGEIIYSVYLSQQYGIERAILTGGDSNYIYHMVKPLCSVPVEMDPYLVGRGLDYYLRTVCRQQPQ